MRISKEFPGDREPIRRVIAEAFDDGGDPEECFEAKIVEACRDAERFDPGLSIVARDGRVVVGHALFTPVWVESDEEVSVGSESVGSGSEGWEVVLALAPIAVAPHRQGEGIGSRLVREGFDRARKRGYRAVVLHGDPEYYGRFGFVPAESRGIENPLDTPSEEFQVAELVSGGLDGIDGPIRYLEPFRELLD